MKKFGFTLMEVNLAMFIMAVGTLGLVSLYSFGYRENQQSNEDVQCAAIAEMNLNAIIAALSSTNMSWQTWKSIGLQPSRGWGDYAGDGSGNTPSRNDGSRSYTPPSTGTINGYASAAFNKVMSAAGKSAPMYQPNGYAVGIVISPSEDYRTYSVAVRCGQRSATLCYQPMFYSEVAFQGLKKEGGN